MCYTGSVTCVTGISLWVFCDGVTTDSVCPQLLCIVVKELETGRGATCVIMLHVLWSVAREDEPGRGCYSCNNSNVASVTHMLLHMNDGVSAAVCAHRC